MKIEFGKKYKFRDCNKQGRVYRTIRNGNSNYIVFVSEISTGEEEKLLYSTSSFISYIALQLVFICHN
jgi:hypothetical protein